MSVQLFHVLPELKLTVSGIKHSAGTHVTTQIIPAFPFVYWPSHKPCEPINMYLLDISHEVTGDSLKTYAAELSHLVRYCGEMNVAIENLSDADIHELSRKLQMERSCRHPLERARNNNTVRTILSQTIRFLQWYQESYMLLIHTPLIGERKVSPKITIKKISNERSRGKEWLSGYYYTHSAMPSSESREPKRPIALPIIEDIQRCIYKQSVVVDRSAERTKHNKNYHEILRAQLEYLRARRTFMIWMMMRTGLRPSELVEMSVQDHENILTTKSLIIPTKKRRKITAPMRRLPITLDAATVVYRYLLSRTAYTNALKNARKEFSPSVAFFLSLDGEPIKKTSLEKDFERMAARAGYRGVQACLSMFRHRFITYEVTVHLREFIDKSGKSRQMMTDIDYESILKRVSAKTGHGSVQSLWHYIDLAWEEQGVWAVTDRALARHQALDQLFSDALLLKHELESSGKRLSKDFQPFLNRLGRILAPTKENIDKK